MKSNAINQFLCIIVVLMLATVVHAQVKTGSNPTAIGINNSLEVEATTGSKVVVTKDNGNTGIGTANPTNKLHVVDTNNPVKIEGLSTATAGAQPLYVESNGVVAKGGGTAFFTPMTRVSVQGTTTQVTYTNGSFLTLDYNINRVNDGNFNMATDTYVVPENGVYLLSATIDYQVNLDNSITLYIDGVEVAGASISPGALYSIGGTITRYYAAGSTISTGIVPCSGCTGGGAYSIQSKTFTVVQLSK